MIWWIVAFVVSGAICFAAWWAWSAEWYDKLMCWVEIIFSACMMIILAFLSIALFMTFEPLGFVVAVLTTLLTYGIGLLAIKIFHRLGRL